MSQSTQATKPAGGLIKLLLVALICGVAADVVLVLPFMLSSEASRMWFAVFGIEPVVLAGVAAREHSQPRRKLGWHVHHRLA